MNFHADKNTSILLLINLDSEKIAEDDERFVQIENDPLYFKKYVLTYTTKAFSTLMQKINSMEVRALEDVVMNNHIFVDLTCNEEYAKLLYTIVHKLPFVPVHIEKMLRIIIINCHSLQPLHLYMVRWKNFPKKRMV